MKKIKISEQQANMLQELGKTKVLKVTKEQYNKIIESERLSENAGPSGVDHSFNTSFNGEAKNTFKDTKIKLEELYKKFVNELYGMNEGSEVNYGKLHKLMEVAGLIKNGRLVKDKFRNDKNIVKEIISMGLCEMHEGGNEYSAMSLMEDLVNSEDTPINENEDYGFIGDKVKNWLDKYYNESADGNIKHIASLFDKGNYNLAYTQIRDKFNGGVLKEGEEEDTPKGIVGLDILNYPPVSQLKETPLDEPTSVKKAKFPGIGRMDATRIIMSHDDITGSEHEYLRVDNKWVFGYVDQFKKKFKEEPIFKLTPEDRFLDVDIINPIYLKARDKHNNGMANMAQSDPGMFKNEQDVDETTVAGSSSTGGSSGSDVAAPLFGKVINRESNVVDELISDDVEIEVANPLRKVTVGILEIVNSGSVKPEVILKNGEYLKELAGSIGDYNDKEDNVINKTLPSIKRKFPIMINTLIRYAENSHDVKVFDQYKEHIKGVHNVLSYIKRKTNEDMMKDEVSETTTTSSVGGEYATSGFPSSNFMGTKGKKGGAPVKTSVKPYMKDAKEVKVKEKCSEFPYCNQGPDAIEVSK